MIMAIKPGYQFGLHTFPTFKGGGEPRIQIQRNGFIYPDNFEFSTAPMDILNSENPYDRLALAIFERAVLDARSKNPECRLDALAWLHSVGYTWLVNLGFTIQPDQYARLLGRLEQPEVETADRRDDHAA